MIFNNYWEFLGKAGNYGEIHLSITPKNKHSNSMTLKYKVYTIIGVEFDFWIGLAQYADADHSNAVSFLEFTALLEAMKVDATDEQIKELVIVFLYLLFT